MGESSRNIFGVTSQTFVPQKGLHRDSTLRVLAVDEAEANPPILRRERFADNGDDISYYEMDAKIEDEIQRETMETTAAATITIKNSPFNVNRKVVNFPRS